MKTKSAVNLDSARPHRGAVANPGITRLAAIAVAFIAVVGAAHAQVRVTATGRVLCINTNVTGENEPPPPRIPLGRVTIKVMNSNSDFDTASDQEMGAGFTREDGTFSVAGLGGDQAPQPYAGPDVYVRVVFGDSKWRQSLGDIERVVVMDEIHRVNVNDTARHDHNNAGPGPIDFGDIVLGVNSDLGVNGDWSCGNFIHAMQAYEEYRAARGGQHPPTGSIQVQRYAWTPPTGSKWADRRYIHWYTSNPSNLSTIRHEFGHTIRHYLDGDDSHFLADAGLFRYARVEGHGPCSVTEPGFAFNEGWASYWAIGNGCSNESGNWNREGDVTKALRDLESCSSRSAMVQVLINAGWNKIHSYSEFENRFYAANPGCKLLVPNLRREVFDAEFYLNYYPDLREAFKTDLVQARNHWLSKGLSIEGRRGSREFDVKFYLSRYADLKNAFGTNYAAALDHWLHQGLPNEGRRGSREFDVKFYFNLHPDLKNAFGTNYTAALDHWLQQGLPNEGRRGSREFDVKFYLSRYADLKSALATNYTAALDHWVNRGLPNEGRRGSQEFDVKFYLATYAELRAAFGSNYPAALDHWVVFGISEGRKGAP